MISFTCPICNALYQYADDMAGRKLRCADCGRKVRIPAADPAAVKNKKEDAEGRVYAHLGIGLYAVVIAGVLVGLFAVLYPLIRQGAERARNQAAATENPPKGKEEPTKKDPDSHDDLVTVAGKCRPSVALITANGTIVRNGKAIPVHGWGSGFLVAPDMIVTNAHVIDGFRMDAVRVSFPSCDGAEKDKEFTPTLLYKNESRDLAVLRIAPVKVKPLFMASKPPTIGCDVAAIGSPHAGTSGGVANRSVNQVNRGNLSNDSYYEAGQKLSFYMTDVSIQKGNSGGPLLNFHGEVIGVIVQLSLYREGDLNSRLSGQNKAIPLPDVLAAIQNAKSNGLNEATVRSVTDSHNNEVGGP